MNYGKDKMPDNVTLCQTALTSKSLSSVEHWYSNIKWEAPSIRHRLEKIHHYCFAKEAYNDRLQTTMINKGVTTLSHWLQCIMLCIHQYSMGILYKPSPELYIADWLSHNNHTENREQEITGMNVNIPTICTAVMSNQACTSDDWWYCHKRQVNNYTLYFAKSNTRTVVLQPHRHWKDMMSGNGISILV